MALEMLAGASQGKAAMSAPTLAAKLTGAEWPIFVLIQLAAALRRGDVSGGYMSVSGSTGGAEGADGGALAVASGEVLKPSACAGV